MTKILKQGSIQGDGNDLAQTTNIDYENNDVKTRDQNIKK